MKALTVWQPWPTAIMWGGKDVENRPRKTNYRGRLWVHAGLHHPDWGDYLTVRALSGEIFGWTDTRRASADQLARVRFYPEHTGALGVILGSVEVTGCHYWAKGCCSSRWGQADQWHWQVVNPQPLAEPVPCKGMLGLWTIPEDIESAARAQLRRETDA
jgi:hypothetical protein